MNKTDIFKKLTDIFSKVLENNSFNLTSETTADDIDGWDSITHMMIINEIEEQFEIKFKLIDLMNMDNVGDLIEAIEKEEANK